MERAFEPPGSAGRSPCRFAGATGRATFQDLPVPARTAALDLEALRIDRSSSPSRRPARRARSPWFGRGVVIALLAVGLWLGWGTIRGFVDGFTLPAVDVLEVRLSSPLRAGAVRGTAANGYVVAARRAALSADTPGRIVEMNVTEGSTVQEGDVVARLFADEYAAAYERALADRTVAEADVTTAAARKRAAEADLRRFAEQVKSADAQVDEAKAALALANEEYGRADALARSGVQAGSRLDVARADRDRALAQLSSARALLAAADAAKAQAEAQIAVATADVGAARARVGTAKAAVALAKATLDKTEIRAPFDGIVVLKDAEVGEVVSPNSQGGSNARGSICTMVDRESLEVQVDLPETSLAAATVGSPVSIFLDAYPDAPYDGRISRVWPVANRQKASVEIRVTIFEKDERLRPDMGVRIVIRPEGAESPTAKESSGPPRLLIPATAVVDVDGQRGVFVLEQDTVRFQTLELDDAADGTASRQLPVLSGLRAGQRIVDSPPGSLRSGDRVRPRGAS